MAKLYRYEAQRVSIHVGDDYYETSSARLTCREYGIVSETPCGYWITFAFGGKDKWVSSSSVKRFAHPTKEEALTAYEYRKKSYVRHAEVRVSMAKEDLALVTMNAILLAKSHNGESK